MCSHTSGQIIKLVSEFYIKTITPGSLASYRLDILQELLRVYPPDAYEILAQYISWWGNNCYDISDLLPIS